MEISKKQLFHLEANQGLINDPNGLIYFKGKYYVFFQWNRLKKNHSYKEWGLFTSENMVDWQFKGTALIPDQYFDINGVYSGSSCIVDNQLYLFYTGNTKINNKRKSYQCLAVSNDGVDFLKKGPVLHTPLEYTEHFRDPKVIKINKNLYYMVIGAQLQNGNGAIALAKSNNGTTWSYMHTLAYTNKYQMIECPDLFRINNQDIILYSLQSRDNDKDEAISSFSCYKIVAFNQESGKIDEPNLDDSYQFIDYGFDFYAPQTFEYNNGRRIMYGWMSRMEDEQEKVFGENEQNIHCLTMPRELFIKKNKLYQRPVDELYSLLGKNIIHINEENDIKIMNPPNRTYYLYLSNLTNNNQLSIKLYGDEVQIVYDKSKKELELYRLNWVTKQSERKYCHINDIDNIEIWSDQSSVEMFINNGEYVLSSRIFPLGLDNTIKIEGMIDCKDIQIKEIIRGGNKYE